MKTVLSLLCRVSHAWGVTAHSVMLLLFLFLVAPTITALSPLEQTVTSPMMATFTCNATGRPRPTIAWYKVELNGSRTLLSDNQSIEMFSGTRSISSTLIINANSPADAADYVCVAINIVNSAQMSATLTVYGELTY